LLILSVFDNKSILYEVGRRKLIRENKNRGGFFYKLKSNQIIFL